MCLFEFERVKRRENSIQANLILSHCRRSSEKRKRTFRKVKKKYKDENECVNYFRERERDVVDDSQSAKKKHFYMFWKESIGIVVFVRAYTHTILARVSYFRECAERKIVLLSE